MLQFSSLIPAYLEVEQLNRGQALEQVGQLTYLFTYAYEYLFADFDSALQGTFENAIFNQNVQLGRLTLLIRSWELFLIFRFYNSTPYGMDLDHILIMNGHFQIKIDFLKKIFLEAPLAVF